MGSDFIEERGLSYAGEEFKVFIREGKEVNTRRWSGRRAFREWREGRSLHRRGCVSGITLMRHASTGKRDRVFFGTEGPWPKQERILFLIQKIKGEKRKEKKERIRVHVQKILPNKVKLSREETHEFPSPRSCNPADADSRCADAFISDHDISLLFISIYFDIPTYNHSFELDDHWILDDHRGLFFICSFTDLTC